MIGRLRYRRLMPQNSGPDCQNQYQATEKAAASIVASAALQDCHRYGTGQRQEHT